MPEIADVPERRGLTHALDRWGASHPDLVLTAPLMVYLLLLGAAHALPENWLPGTIALRGVGSLAVVWMFRRHLPPWGKPHWPIAIFGGALIGWGWVCGQAWLDDLGLSGRLSIFPGSKVVADPREALGAGSLLWTTWWVRMTVAITAVPVVEEIFWRAFMLRVLIDWHGFE